MKPEIQAEIVERTEKGLPIETLKHPTRSQRRQRRIQMQGYMDARREGIIILNRDRRMKLRAAGLWRSRRRKGGMKHGR